MTRVCLFADSAAAVGYSCAHGEVGGGVGGVNAATQWSDTHDHATTPGGAVGELVSIRVYRSRQVYSQHYRTAAA